mmetsp:Transcript_36595/g.100714  ORF Transcript_36595/g.100714 Transcript_36595/m.100714 type:complete len:131 (-) Transcript_36595:645-1037(-)
MAVVAATAIGARVKPSAEGAVPEGPMLVPGATSATAAAAGPSQPQSMTKRTTSLLGEIAIAVTVVTATATKGRAVAKEAAHGVRKSTEAMAGVVKETDDGKAARPRAQAVVTTTLVASGEAAGRDVNASA